MPLEICTIFMLDMAGSGWNLENSSGYCWKSVLFLCWMLLEVGGISQTPMDVVGCLCHLQVGCCRKWVEVAGSHCKPLKPVNTWLEVTGSCWNPSDAVGSDENLLHANGKGSYVDGGEQMLLGSTGVHWYHPFSHQNPMKSIKM